MVLRLGVLLGFDRKQVKQINRESLGGSGKRGPLSKEKSMSLKFASHVRKKRSD